MRLFNNHSNTNRLPMKGKVKRGFRTYCAVVCGNAHCELFHRNGFCC